MISRRAKGVGRITGLSRNIVSLLGAALVFASGLSIAFLFIIEATGEHDNPYLGIFT